MIGEVPVEQDGSAYFVVPSDKAIYFQALDEDHMEIRRMRTHVTFQPGETRGCIGCHETQLKTPSMSWNSLAALERSPQVPTHPPWGSDRLLGYEWLIQPILDRHCLACHGAEQPAGGVELSNVRAEDGFLQSFRTMFGRKAEGEEKGKVLVSVVDRRSGSSVSQPMQFGSHRSQLVKVLKTDPLHVKEVQLEPDDWLALVTWIDANAPYFDAFYNRRPVDANAPRRDIVPKLDSPFAEMHSEK